MSRKLHKSLPAVGISNPSPTFLDTVKRGNSDHFDQFFYFAFLQYFKTKSKWANIETYSMIVELYFKLKSNWISINYSIIKLTWKWLSKSRKKILWKTLSRSIVKSFGFGKSVLKINSKFIKLILHVIRLEDFERRAAIFQHFPNQLSFRGNSDHPSFRLVVAILHL